MRRALSGLFASRWWIVIIAVSLVCGCELLDPDDGGPTIAEQTSAGESPATGDADVDVTDGTIEGTQVFLWKPEADTRGGVTAVLLPANIRQEHLVQEGLLINGEEGHVMEHRVERPINITILERLLKEGHLVRRKVPCPGSFEQFRGYVNSNYPCSSACQHFSENARPAANFQNTGVPVETSTVSNQCATSLCSLFPSRSAPSPEDLRSFGGKKLAVLYFALYPADHLLSCLLFEFGQNLGEPVVVFNSVGHHRITLIHVNSN